MVKVQIFLLGKFKVVCDAQPLSGFNTINVQQLLSYLLLNRDRQHTRETLAALFWPEVIPARSKGYLRKSLWQIQRAFNGHLPNSVGSVVLAENEWIYLNPDVDIWLDVTILECAFRRTEGISGDALNNQDVQIAKDAISAYRDDLLVGWSQDWCLYERERLQRYYIILLDKLVNHCLHTLCFELGLNYAMRSLRKDPARERTHRALMRLFYLSGDRTAALHQYDQCKAILRAELDVEPTKRTQLLYEMLCVDKADYVRPSTLYRKSTLDAEPLEAALLTLEWMRADLYKVHNRLENEIAKVQRLLGIDTETD